MARVKMVISLTNHIRSIQSINLCHNDIHLGNILMDIDEDGSVENPKVSGKIIDFGNAYDLDP